MENLQNHKKLIVPAGLLDPTKNNIIHIPKYLAQSQAPLVVAQSRKGLVARLLPNFDDELSQEHPPNFQNLTVIPMICPVENRLKKTSNNMEDSRSQSQSNKTFSKASRDSSGSAPSATSTPRRGPTTDSNYSSGDSPGSMKLVHASSRSRQQVDNLPAEGHSITIDAPSGVNVNTLETMGRQSLRPGI